MSKHRHISRAARVHHYQKHNNRIKDVQDLIVKTNSLNQKILAKDESIKKLEEEIKLSKSEKIKDDLFEELIKIGIKISAFSAGGLVYLFFVFTGFINDSTKLNPELADYIKGLCDVDVVRWELIISFSFFVMIFGIFYYVKYSCARIAASILRDEISDALYAVGSFLGIFCIFYNIAHNNYLRLYGIGFGLLFGYIIVGMLFFWLFQMATWDVKELRAERQ